MLNDLRYAIRTLAKSPTFTAAVVLTLALGIGANTAMFSIIHRVLLKPLPFEDPARLVLARCTIGGAPNPLVSAPDYYDYREQSDVFAGFSAIFPVALKTTVTSGSEPERVAFTYVEHDLFRTLGVAPIAGRDFTLDESHPGGPAVAMISAGYAQRQFGDARKAVGASLRTDGNAHTVVGVVPAAFHLIDDFDVWLPMRRGEAIASPGRKYHNWLIVGRLKPGVTLPRAQGQLDVISKRLEQQYPDSNAGKALRVDPLQTVLVAPQTPRLLALMAAVGLVLLIACANVAGLFLARGAARRPALAVRAALGASPARIARELLVESLTLALASGVLGVALALWLNRLLPLAVDLGDTGSSPGGLAWPVLAFAFGLSVLTGLLFGVAPALRASSSLLEKDLAPGARSSESRGGISLRKGLVAGQVAVSLVLLVGAGLLIRSFAHLISINPGFEIQHLLTGEISLPEAQYADRSQRIAFFDGLRDDLVHVPGVHAVGLTSHLPIRNRGFNLPVWDTDHPPATPAYQRTAFRRIVLPGYFDALRIPLLSGRDLSKDDRESTPLTAVINQGMAETLFPGSNPLGRRVSVEMFGPRPLTFEVVGVVGDVRLNSIGDSAPMTMYLSYYQFPETALRFAIRADEQTEGIAETARRLVAARDAGIAVERLVSMERVIGGSIAPQRATAALSALLALVALLLAGIGLYGALAYWVTQRSREIGIRMALGAKPGELLRLVLRQGVVLVSVGVAVGLIGAVGLTRFLASLLFGVPPTDIGTIVVVSLGLIGVALLASYVPARRAAKVDPMVTLRCE
jgi:predicted permease